MAPTNAPDSSTAARDRPRADPLAPSAPDPALAEDPGLVLTTGPGVSRHWLESMRRDGLVVPVGAAHYLAADAAQWPALRRLALLAVIPPGHIVQAMTAAWAYGAQIPESELRRIYLRPAPAQPRTAEAPGLVISRGRLPSDAVTVIDGLGLTTPAWTAAELAIAGGPAAESVLSWMLGPGGARTRVVLPVLRRRTRGPLLRRASRTVEQLSGMFVDGDTRFGPPGESTGR